MRIKKTEQSVGIIAKVLNSISNSLVNTYSASFINKLVLNISHPVNSIYISTSAEDPAGILGGGEWIRFAKGKTLVGVDENDVDFNEVEKELGEKKHQLTIDELASHLHNIYYNNKSGIASGSALGTDRTASMTAGSSSGGTWSVWSTRSGKDQAHNNIQPSITVYFWKRVA